MNKSRHELIRHELIRHEYIFNREDNHGPAAHNSDLNIMYEFYFISIYIHIYD